MNLNWFGKLVANLRGPLAKRSRKRVGDTLRSGRRSQFALHGFETLEERRVLALAAQFDASTL